MVFIAADRAGGMELSMKIFFMGTPDIAAHCLKALIDGGHNICGVFTQPDRPKGRGMKEAVPPVKILAESAGIPVWQPLKIRRSFDIIEEVAPDVIIVVAYGKLLPVKILDFPKYGAINLHASLLPKLRGAAPIQRAIVNGDTVGGVTTMYMAEKLDAGDIILAEQCEISDTDTAETLTGKYTDIGAKLLLKTLDMIERGTVPRFVQDEEQVTFAPPISKEEAMIEWGAAAEQIRNLIRGFNPAPVAFTEFDGQNLKVFSAERGNPDSVGNVGEIISMSKKGPEIMTGSGTLILTEVQASGKKRMNAADWMRGKRVEVGMRLGGQHSEG